MKYIFCVIFIFSFCVAYSQQPSGVPTQKINGWIQNWYTVPDSGIVAPRRDTNWTPSKLGMMITWPHAGVDTVPWFWNGAKWGKTFSPQATSDSSFFYIDYIPQTTDPSYNEGRLFYDNANKTLSLFDAISGTSLQIGQEQYARARNNTGSQINDGSVVYISGASGQTPTIALALANSTNTTGVLGVATHNISNNSVGKVTTFGLVNNINTSSFLAGDKLYLSPTTPGGITNVEPDVPNFSVFIGYCLNSHITQGKIFVSPIQRVVQIHQINDTSFVSIVGTIIDTIRISSAAAGTVTSVGLSMPSAFNVTGSPITSSGVFGVSGAGTALQYIRGNGTLAIFDTAAIPNFYLKGRGLLSGTPPITYNNTTGTIGISNASATGAKGAATFNNADFTDNGSGLISLRNVNGCNVLKEGADTTGSIDASAIVQSLINGGCSVIYMPAGKYLFSNTIEMRDSVTILGDGRNNTVIKLATNIPAFHAGHNGQYSQFIGIDIEGTFGTATTAQEGIFCDSAASIYIHNVGGYKLGGFAVRFKHDLYNRPYPGTGLVGSIISDCNFESCYGGIKLDTNAEYVGISNSVMVANTYGLHLIGGNSRVSNCNVSSNTYGIYMTNGPNDHHGNAVGNNINHNTYNIYMDSVPGGYTFVGNLIYAGANQLYINQSRNIEFLGGDIVGTGTATFINNDTTIHFLDVNMRTKPTFSITGNAPNIINTREAQGFAFYDAVNAKRFDMSYANDSATFTGNLAMIRIPTSKVRIGTPSSSTHKLVVNYPNNDVAGKTLAAFGSHVSNGIAVTIGDIDTLTSTNSANLMARTYQFHKRLYCKDDNLTLGSWKAGFNFFGLHANNTTNISNPSGQSYNCVINSLGYQQFPNITGTSTINASSSVVNTTASTESFTVLTNNGGSSLLNLKGWYGGYGTYIQMSARDTIENYAAYSSGAHEINAAARLKTFYHHYMHTNPGQTNWGVYQEGASVGNYFNGTVGVNTNAPVYGLFVNRSIGQSKDSSELVASVTSESVQLIDTITGRFKRIPLSNLSAKNISNASLTANGNYSHNWAGKNLLIDSINIQQLLARGVDISTGKRLNVYYTSVGTGAAGRPLTAGAALRNTANSADSVLNEFRVQSEQTKMYASTTAGDKSSELYLNPFSANIIAHDSVLISPVPNVSSSDTLLIPVLSQQVANGWIYKIAKMPASNIASAGLYTPTVTGTLNVDAVTAHQCRYTRVGNIVFVGGVVEIDPTAASATSATITLPVSSTFTSSDDINGVVSVNELTTPNAHITRSGNIALLAFTSGTTSNFALYFTFSYEVK